ncbi:MAG: lipopolysaccharide biosynthesis protein [Oscillospiraceae bacterium]|nr:lipopolysaccharide biosynthesis protein [Oscillospiraceae bacterium]
MDKKLSVLTNFIWRLMERGGTYLMNFIVSIILARLLDPSLYGSIALVTAITTILQVFVDSGMANSLIQKKDTDDLDYSSVFYFNLAFCLLLYCGLFLAAPLIGRLYHDPSLTPVIRVLGLTVVVSGVKNVQQAYVAKTMQFRRFFFATLGGTIFSAAVGIVLAYLDYGVWALVFQQLLNVTVNTAILWLTVGWKPRRMFSWQRLGGLISYGWKLLVSQLLDTAYLKLYQFIIGLRYSTADLAFYNRAEQFPLLITENTSSALDSVLLPVLSSEQDDPARVREMTRRAVKVSTYILMPLMAGLAACAEPMIRFLLTDKWLPCVPYLRLFCLFYAVWPVHTANLNAIKAMGHSDIFLGQEIIKKVLETGILLFTMRYGVMAICLGLLVSGFLSLIINAWPNRRLLALPLLRQLLDILPSCLLSLAMGLAILPVTRLDLSDPLKLLIMVPAGVAIYLAGSKLFRLDSFDYVLDAAKKLLQRRGAAEN